MNQEKVKALVKTLLSEIGEDPKREGLLSTPKRVAKAYEFLTKGYQQDIAEVMNKAVFNERYDEMVLVKNIDFYSMCEHHLLPFQEVLEPHGVGVVIEARHLCMMMRGVEKQNSSATTSAMLGVFQEDARTRMEFLDLIAHKNL